jgi:hypothetical protein
MQTLIQYDLNKPLYGVARHFKSYRKLFMNLYRGLFDESRSQSALESELLELEKQFPRTFKRSMFGIKLGATELNQRCSGLGYWMHGIITRYYKLDAERKVRIFHVCLFVCL